VFTNTCPSGVTNIQNTCHSPKYLPSPSASAARTSASLRRSSSPCRSATKPANNTRTTQNYTHPTDSPSPLCADTYFTNRPSRPSTKPLSKPQACMDEHAIIQQPPASPHPQDATFPHTQLGCLLPVQTTACHQYVPFV
jgi:hypothetical protein